MPGSGVTDARREVWEDDCLGRPGDAEGEPLLEPAPRLFLEFIAGAERGVRVPVFDPEILVGRGKGGATTAPWIIVDDRTVSRHHVTLTWKENDGHYWLQNVSQTNLTQVNGMTVSHVRLRVGDTLRLGNVLFVVHAGDGSLVPPRTRRAMRATPPPVKLRVSRIELAQVFNQVGTMIGVGICITRALGALAEKGSSPAMRQACSQLADSVQKGATLSEAMRAQGSTFSALHVCSVEAGEASGRLPEVLGELGNWEERDVALSRAFASGLTYPLAVLMCGIGLVFFLGHRVFATLLPVLTASGKPLPLLTQGLVTVTGWTQQPLAVLAGLALAGVAGRLLWVGWNSRGGRMAWERLSLSLPVFGSLVKKLFVARFCNHMNLLYDSGIPLFQALETSTRLSRNQFVRQALVQANQGLVKGLSLADSLEETGQFPRMVIGMVRVGEDSGDLGLMLRKLSRMYDDEVYDTLDSMVKMLEPLVIAIMGVIVAIIMIATILPLYQLIAI